MGMEGMREELLPSTTLRKSAEAGNDKNGGIARGDGNDKWGGFTVLIEKRLLAWLGMTKWGIRFK